MPTQISVTASSTPDQTTRSTVLSGKKAESGKNYPFDGGGDLRDSAMETDSNPLTCIVCTRQATQINASNNTTNSGSVDKVSIYSISTVTVDLWSSSLT
jgi:hypothetical protein